MDLGSIPEWTGLVLQLVAAFAGGSVGVSAMGVHRTRTDDRRRILIDLLPALYAAEPSMDYGPEDKDWLDAGLRVLNATHEISSIVALLPWPDRTAWLTAEAMLKGSGIGPVPESGHEFPDQHVTFFDAQICESLELFENRLRNKVNPTRVSRFTESFRTLKLMTRSGSARKQARENRQSVEAKRASDVRSFNIQELNQESW